MSAIIKDTISRKGVSRHELPEESTRNIGNIPGPPNFPFVGNTLSFRRDPLNYLQNMRTQHGDVFALNFTHKFKAVFLLGAESNEFVLLDKNRIFSNRLGYKAHRRFLGDNILVRDFDEHRQLRKMMIGAFRPASLNNYLRLMNSIIKPEIACRKETLLFYPFIKALTLNIASRVFFGLELGKDAAMINKHMSNAVKAITSPFPYAIPGNTYWKGLKGRDYVKNYLRHHLHGKRLSNSEDLFCTLATISNDEGDMLSDDDVVDNMLGIFAAAHDTTTCALTMMAYALAKHPDWQNAVREECNLVWHFTRSDSIDYDHLASMEVTEWVFKEALRLYAPLQFIARRTLKDCVFKNYRLPVNCTVLISPHVTHRCGSTFEDPNKFNPDRFSTIKEQEDYHPFAWIPFGKGSHMCLGQHFSLMEVRAVLYQFLRRYELSLPADYELVLDNLPMSKPRDGLPLTLTPLKLDS